MQFTSARSGIFPTITVLLTLLVGATADNILQTSGFSSCGGTSDIEVQKLNITYNAANRQVDFDVAGTSTKVQKVKASLIVFAYGQQVYQKTFNPCDNSSYVAQLCPVPQGTFAAAGSQDIPATYASLIPSIAFDVPDLDGTAKLELTAVDTGNGVACIESTVDNGKTTQMKAVPVVAAGIAGAALVVSGLSAALGAGGGAATTAPSPSFFEMMWWFQGMAMNGMMSVDYPSVYRSFARNFGFSTGLIPWTDLQVQIDNFRAATGGNLTENSVQYLQNATLVYQDSDGSTSNVTKRAIMLSQILERSLTTSIDTGVNVTASNTNSTSSSMHVVKGIEAFVEQLTIPKSNTFLTILLIFAIVNAAIIVSMLLFKLILELCSLFTKKFPKSLENFRKRYWWYMAKTITNLVLLLYGVFTLYCVYQFTHGDSWAAQLLAGVALGIFTGILCYFSVKIIIVARKYKQAEGSAEALFEDKETWRKYSLFYENYKKGYWWLFLPTIVYMFAKGAVIAAGDGHGMFQTAGQLIIEGIMLILLLWSRPYSRKSGNWINIIIQVVRVLSVLCILIFVEQLGIAQTPKTITGVVLIVMQSVLTGVLAILIAVNAIILLFRANPHRQARKEAEKQNKRDTLTPLETRNTMLLSAGKGDEKGMYSPVVHVREGSDSSDHFSDVKLYSDDQSSIYYPPSRKGTSFISSRGISPAPSTVGSMRAPLLPQVNPHYRRQGY